MNSLFGAVITTGNAVISNNPSADPRRCGIPNGHPSLDAFLGLPLYNGDTMVGMIGLANHPGGYEPEIIEFLKPILATCAHIIEGYRIDQKRKEAEMALFESERQYRNLFESSRDGVFITSTDGRVIDINNAGLKILGYSSKDELQQLNATDVYLDISRRQDFLRNIEHHGFVKNFEVEIRGKNGNRIILHLSATAERDVDGNISFIRGIAHDMTEYKKLEQQLLQAQKMEAIGQLTGGIAHDFNNIITGIMGFANLIKMKNSNRDQSIAHYCSQIMNLSERAGKLTHGLLTFSRKQSISLSPVNLNTIVSKFESFIKRIVRENIEIDVELSSDDLTIIADSGQIEQVIMNLVANANDSIQGNGKLTISTELVKSEDDRLIKNNDFHESGDFACLIISDTGIGMNEETKGRIFEPFFTTKEVGKGTGLGLSIVYGIVNSHKGHTNVYSEPGIGTTFRIYFPLVNTVALPDTSQELETPLYGTETILLTEDDSYVLQVTSAILEEYGYTVLTASNGEEAVEKFREYKDRIRLIIVDVIMPRKNGRETYIEIKEISPDMPFIFTSGYTEDIISNRMIVEEHLNFLSKPITSKSLLTMVRKVLDDDNQRIVRLH